jgi:hypothetical protein
VYFCLSTFDCRLEKAVDKFFWEISITDVNIDKFCLFLRRQDWISVAHVNAKYDAFIKIVLAGFQNFFPMVKKIQRANQQGKVVGSIAMCEKAACGVAESSRCVVREIPDPFMKVHFQRQLKDKKFKYVQQLSLEIKNSNSNFIAAASNKSRAAWSVLLKSISSRVTRCPSLGGMFRFLGAPKHVLPSEHKFVKIPVFLKKCCIKPFFFTFWRDFSLRLNVLS